jgi:transposase
MAELAKCRLRSKSPLLEQALTALVREQHRRLLAIQLAHMDCLDEQRETRSAEITRDLTELSASDALPATSASSAAADGAAAPAVPSTPLPFTRAIILLDMIPGVDRCGAKRWVAETGFDMARFGSAALLAPWVGVAPGNAESAGKQRSGRTRHGTQPLGTVLTQLAQAAAQTKGTYLSGNG